MSDRVLPLTSDDEYGVPAPLKERIHSINIAAQGNLTGFDKDGDGKITRYELEEYVAAHVDTVKEKVLLKKALIGVTILFILFAGVIGM